MTLYAVPSPPAPPSDPFASPGWERAGADGTFGNRFDDPSKVDGRPDKARFRMIYAATQREAAFAETIAHFRPDLPALAALRTIHGGASEPQPLTGVVSVRWQQRRGIGRLLLDAALRFVDGAHPDTLAEMRATFARLAVDLGHCDRCADLWWDPLSLAPWSDVGVLGALRGSAGRRAAAREARAGG